MRHVAGFHTALLPRGRWGALYYLHCVSFSSDKSSLVVVTLSLCGKTGAAKNALPGVHLHLLAGLEGIHLVDHQWFGLAPLSATKRTDSYSMVSGFSVCHKRSVVF